MRRESTTRDGAWSFGGVSQKIDRRSLNMYWLKLLVRFLLLVLPILLFWVWVLEVLVLPRLGSEWSLLLLAVPLVTYWMANWIWPFRGPGGDRD